MKPRKKKRSWHNSLRSSCLPVLTRIGDLLASVYIFISATPVTHPQYPTSLWELITMSHWQVRIRSSPITSYISVQKSLLALSKKPFSFLIFQEHRFFHLFGSFQYFAQLDIKNWRIKKEHYLAVGFCSCSFPEAAQASVWKAWSWDWGPMASFHGRLHQIIVSNIDFRL